MLSSLLESAVGKEEPRSPAGLHPPRSATRGPGNGSTAAPAPTGCRTDSKPAPQRRRKQPRGDRK